MVKRPDRRRLHDVETRQVSACGASITIGHDIYGIGSRRKSFITSMLLALIRKRLGVEGIGVVERKDGVEGHPFIVDIETFGIDQSTEGVGVTNLADEDGPGHRLEKDDSSSGESLRNPLINPNRGNVVEFNGASPMAKDATLNNDAVIRDVYLVRAPTPHSGERYEYERSGENETEEYLVLMDEVDVLRAENDGSDHHDRDESRARDASRNRCHRDNPDLTVTKGQSLSHTYKRTNTSEVLRRIPRESPVNIATRRFASGARPCRNRSAVQRTAHRSTGRGGSRARWPWPSARRHERPW